eukprot:7337101-Karenia_brevis.AAC.1
MQQRAITKLKDERPWLLIVSPPCTPFSSLQWWNFPRMERDKVHKLFEDGLKHLAFAVTLCIAQVKAGRKFILEHP